MHKPSLLILVTVLAVIPQFVSAKTIDKYGIAVKVENDAPGGRYINDYQDMAAAISHALGGPGFTCTSSLSVSQEETIQDAKGRDFAKTYNYKNDFTFTALGQPQAAGEINVNFDNKNPHLDIRLSQNCNGRVPGMCEDEKGRQQFCMREISVPMSWNCSVAGNQYPRPSTRDRQNLAAARDREFVCQPSNNMAFFNGISDVQSALIMNVLQKKKITTTLSYLGKTEHFEKINCPSDEEIARMDPALQKIFRFAGGIKDGAITQTAKYEISVNHLGPVYKERNDGLSNFDVLYCKNNPDEEVNVTVGVKTKNKVYDPQTFTAAKGNVLESHRLPFKKDGMLWGSWDSQIDVKTVPATITTAK